MIVAAACPWNLGACALLFAALAPSLVHAVDRPDDVPSWVLHGILAVETASHYSPAGDVVYVNRKRGSGAGPFQIELAAFTDVARPRESYKRLHTSWDFGEDIALRYLRWLHRYFNPTKEWSITVARYHVGPHGDITSNAAIDYAGRAFNAGHAAVRGRQ